MFKVSIREMQIKAIVRHHFTPVSMPYSRKDRNNKCWEDVGGKGTLYTAGNNVDPTPMEDSGEFSEN